MKIEGHIEMVFRDKDTNEITKVVNAQNDVTEWWIGAMANYNYLGNSNYNYGRFGQYIMISDALMETTDKWTSGISKATMNAMGYVQSGITSPRSVTNGTYPNYNDIYLEHQQRFDNPATTRTIRVVGLTNGASYSNNNWVYGSYTDMNAWVKLTVPCIQTTTETLDVFYRIKFIPEWTYGDPVDMDFNGITPRQAVLMRDLHFNGSGESGRRFSNMTRISWSPAALSHTKIQYTNSYFNSNYEYMSSGRTYTAREQYREGEMTQAYGLNDFIGRIVGGFKYGEGQSTGWGISLWFAPLYQKDSTHSPVQNIFGHASTATKPFYDSTALHTGTGTIQINGNNWTNPDYPKMLRIDVTGTGGLGVGTYRFQMRNTFGFFLNFYRDAFGDLPTMHHYNNIPAFEGFNLGYDTVGSDVQWHALNMIKYDHRTLIMIYYNDILFVDTVTGEGKRYHPSKVPAFTATNINQIEVDETTGTVWVACRDSGIYKITDPLGTRTVTKIDNTTTGLTGLGSSTCFGVTVGVAGRVWAVFNGGLFYTDNQGTSWSQATFVDSNITVDWTRVHMIKADPSHVNHRLAIVHHRGTVNTVFIDWWDTSLSGGTAIAGPQLAVLPTSLTQMDWSPRYMHTRRDTWFNMLQVSPTQNKWAASRPTSAGGRHRPAYFTYGTTTVTAGGTDLYGNHTGSVFETDEDGNESILVYDYSGDWRNSRIGFFKSSGVYSWNTVQLTDQEYRISEAVRHSHLCYLGNGVGIYRVGYNNGTIGSAPGEYFIGAFGAADIPNGGGLHNMLWDEYGWNGSQWVKGHSGSKAFHGTEEDLIDGLKIKFDDASGTQTFVATDYYTTGIVNGVWLDGSTTVSHTFSLYYGRKLVENATDIEFNTLPATVSPSYYTYSNNYQTTTVNFINLTTNVTNDSANSGIYTNSNNNGWFGGRSQPIIYSNRNASNDTYLGSVNMRPRDNGLWQYPSNPARLVMGLSPSSVLGSPITNNTSPAHAFFIDSTPYAVSGNNKVDIHIMKNGTIIASPLLANQNCTGAYAEWLMFFTIQVYKEPGGTTCKMKYKFQNQLLYEETGIPLTDFVLDIALSGVNGTGIRRTSLDHKAPNDYYINLGDPTLQTGRFEPGFFSILPHKNMQILINGVPATNIGTNNISTVLSAGQVAVFDNGQIRYSAADAGKSISVVYSKLKLQ